MPTTLSVGLKKRKYELAIFASLCLSFCILLIKGNALNDRMYGGMVFDTRFGIHSLTLIGQIMDVVFGPHATRAQATVFHVCATVLAFALTAAFCGGSVRRGGSAYRTELVSLAVIASCAHIGFSSFNELYGLLDVYWLIGAVLALFAAKNQYSRFAAPLLALTSMWVHHGFLLTYMPLLYVACIYYYFKRKTVVGFAQLAVGLVLTVAGAVYFAFSARMLVNVEPAEILSYMKEKTGVNSEEIGVYVYRHFTSNNYSDMQGFYDLYGTEVTPLYLLRGYMYIVKDLSSGSQFVTYALLSVPPLALFESVWLFALKHAVRKQDKFVFLLCMLTPLVSIAAVVTSTDTSRMTAHMFIEQVLLLMLFVRENDENVEYALSRIMPPLRRRSFAVACASAVYFALICRW